MDGHVDPSELAYRVGDDSGNEVEGIGVDGGSDGDVGDDGASEATTEDGEDDRGDSS